MDGHQAVASQAMPFPLERLEQHRRIGRLSGRIEAQDLFDQPGPERLISVSKVGPLKITVQYVDRARTTLDAAEVPQSFSTSSHGGDIVPPALVGVEQFRLLGAKLGTGTISVEGPKLPLRNLDSNGNSVTFVVLSIVEQIVL